MLELSTSSGQRIRAFSDKSGAFVLNDVPAGTHLLHVITLGYMFPEVGAWGWGVWAAEGRTREPRAA